MRAGGVGVLALAISGMGATVWSVVAEVVPDHGSARAARSPQAQGTPGPYAAESLARAVTARDLFRSDRRSGSVPYDPLRGEAAIPEGPRKPTLNLTGLVWGEVPQAVVEGLPTTEGPRVVRAGDVVGGLTIRRIEMARVVIVGMDTTWTLVLREPWR